jgi:hypothetical protein
MPYTDIVKARAIRRAGRACEMCGAPLKFDSAHFVSAHPIFGMLFDQDDCCVLCRECLDDLDNETRAAAEESPPSSHGSDRDIPSDEADRGGAADRGSGAGAGPADAAKHGQGDADLPAAARESWFPERGPDDDMCA